MSWLSDLTDEQREEMQAIRENINHVKSGSSCKKYLKFDGKKVVEVDRSSAIPCRSMFPYRSTSMAVDPNSVESVHEQLLKQGVSVDFDKEGRPEITSALQHRKIAEAMGMYSGRDGYGHIDEDGNSHNSGRRRAQEMKEGQAGVDKAINELNAMPDDVPEHFITDVLDKYNI